MLSIKGEDGKWVQWWVGNWFPEVEGRVVTFQADGHELFFLLDALQLREKYDPYKHVEVENHCPACEGGCCPGAYFYPKSSRRNR